MSGFDPDPPSSNGLTPLLVQRTLVVEDPTGMSDAV
jgi:hypothetical protein